MLTKLRAILTLPTIALREFELHKFLKKHCIFITSKVEVPDVTQYRHNGKDKIPNYIIHECKIKFIDYLIEKGHAEMKIVDNNDKDGVAIKIEMTGIFYLKGEE